MRCSDFKIEVDRSRKENPTSAEPRIREMQHETLTRIFVEAMIECNIIQEEHREKCKDRFKRQLEISKFYRLFLKYKNKNGKHIFAVQNIAGHSTTDEELEEMLEQNNPAIFTQEVDQLIPIIF